MKNEKFNNFLVWFGAVCLIIVPVLLIDRHDNSRNIEKMALGYYTVEEKIKEMVSTNQDVIVDSGASESYDYYNYDDFEDAFRDYNHIVEDISKIAN